MTATTCVSTTDLSGLKLRARGKVRDIYEYSDEQWGDCLLIIATDRVSAFDWVLDTPVPHKGAVLTGLSMFWFDRLSDIAPNHVITADVDEMPESIRVHADVLRGRSMFCRKAKPFDAECIVRGYLTGSGWKDYQRTGAVCGIELAADLPRNAPITPAIFTPSTKADVGLHDENIDGDVFRQIVGEEWADALEKGSLDAFTACSEYAATRGVTICDTKMEWGLVDGELTIIDEVFTPDSSRFWKTSELEATPAGGDPPSFDKQVVRNWLETTDWNKESAPPTPSEEIVALASARYLEIYERLTGSPLI